MPDLNLDDSSKNPLEELREALRKIFENKVFIQEMDKALSSALQGKPVIWESPLGENYIFTSIVLKPAKYPQAISNSQRPIFQFYEYWLYADNAREINGMDYEIVPLDDVPPSE